MTDEEKDKTEKEYKEWLVNDHKLLDNPTYYDIEQKCFRAFFAGTRYGLAEGRKEKCFEQNKDGTIRPCEIMKENEQLKAQIEKIKNNYKKQRNKRIDELQKGNSELKNEISTMKSFVKSMYEANKNDSYCQEYLGTIMNEWELSDE